MRLRSASVPTADINHSDIAPEVSYHSCRSSYRGKDQEVRSKAVRIRKLHLNNPPLTPQNLQLPLITPPQRPHHLPIHRLSQHRRNRIPNLLPHLLSPKPVLQRKRLQTGKFPVREPPLAGRVVVSFAAAARYRLGWLVRVE